MTGTDAVSCADGASLLTQLPLFLCRLGIPSDPVTFVHRAVLAGHPSDLVGQIGELLRKTILMNFYQPPHEVAKIGINFVKKYSALAMELKA